MTCSLREYDAERYGPFLGISDDGSAATAIGEAALGSPKARALEDPDPVAIGIAHDAERLGSVGEVPVGRDQYDRIRTAHDGKVLLTTNVGSHVNLWHYRQPASLQVSAETSTAEVVAWGREHGAGLRQRDTPPWLRIRFEAGMAREAMLEKVRAAVCTAPVAIAVSVERGTACVNQALELVAEAGAAAVVVDGAARAPSEGRPALPGLLNYFDPKEARQLLDAARRQGVAIEPALKIDTASVANQIWAGLYAARAMGMQLGKFGLFPLTFGEMVEVVRPVQDWMRDWAVAPVLYLDVPSVDGYDVYGIADAAAAASRWLELIAETGTSIVLIDTVDKSLGRRLIKEGAEDAAGILTWGEVKALQLAAAERGVKVLWAGGISLDQVRRFGELGSFGVYVTSAVAEAAPVGTDEDDIGLSAAKRPVHEKIACAKALLEAGFLGGEALEQDAVAVERGGKGALERLEQGLVERWRQRLR